jgi:hypothetical protein
LENPCANCACRGFLGGYNPGGPPHAARLAALPALALRGAVQATGCALCLRGTFVRASLGKPDVDPLRNLVLTMLAVRS